MNIKHIFALTALVACASACTADEHQITSDSTPNQNQPAKITDLVGTAEDANNAPNTDATTENIEPAEKAVSSSVIENEQPDVEKKPLSKTQITAITLLLGIHGYVLAMPFMTEKYILEPKWLLALPIIIGGLLSTLSDRMSNRQVDSSSDSSNDSSDTDDYTYHNNPSNPFMYQPTYDYSIYTPTYTPPIHFF